MRVRGVIALFACILVTIGGGLRPLPSDAARQVTLDRPSVRGDTVVLKGRAPTRAKVRIVRSTESGWTLLTTDRANRHGRYRVLIARPADQEWVVRAVSRGTSSKRRTVTPTPTDIESPPPDACGKRLPKADGTWWDCTFVDDFDGTAIDSGKWLAQDTSVTGVANGRSCYIGNKPSAMAVADGSLQLTAQHFAEEFTCKSPLGDFTTDRASATVTTKGRFSQILGRFAFRAKMPTTRVQGAHPAIWLYPNDQAYGRWPLSGEIDVAEWYSALPEKVFPSVHYIDGLNDIHTGKRGTFDDVSDWHIYELEWDADVMRFIYDGNLIWEHDWAPLAPLIGNQPFDQPFNLVLTQAWGGLWNAPNKDTPDRVTMTVDWVRVWK